MKALQQDAFKTASRVSLGLVVLGFVGIFVAWNGAASKDYVSGQLPYLISGGAGGLGLIGVGLSILNLQNSRREREGLQNEIATLSRALENVTAASGASTPATAKASKAAIASGRFVAGASTFHSPDCRLAAGRDGSDLVTLEEADERGLRPCRICNPG